jgi:hypothetical protein
MAGPSAVRSIGDFRRLTQRGHTAMKPRSVQQIISKRHCPTWDNAYVHFMQHALFARRIHAEIVRTTHGGAAALGRRKLERPVSTRRPMHVVLASDRARGPWSLRKHEGAVRVALRRMARRFDIRVYDFANVGSHLHLLLRVRRRASFQAFLRSLTGIVARRVTGARRGHPCGPFFSALAWSRVVSWGRDYLGVRHYVFRNAVEGALGASIRRALELGPSPMNDLPQTPARAGPGQHGLSGRWA